MTSALCAVSQLAFLLQDDAPGQVGNKKSPMQYCFEAEPIEVHGVVVASYGSECCLTIIYRWSSQLEQFASGLCCCQQPCLSELDCLMSPCAMQARTLRWAALWSTSI